jgi:hypothetical protein
MFQISREFLKRMAQPGAGFSLSVFMMLDIKAVQHFPFPGFMNLVLRGMIGICIRGFRLCMTTETKTLDRFRISMPEVARTSPILLAQRQRTLHS